VPTKLHQKKIGKIQIEKLITKNVINYNWSKTFPEFRHSYKKVFPNINCLNAMKKAMSN
jgi:hypothetical protein